MTRKRRRRRSNRDEKAATSDIVGTGDLLEWVDWGDQRIMVMGYTSGGAPFGLTEDEYYSDVTDVNGFDHVDDDEPF